LSDSLPKLRSELERLLLLLHLDRLLGREKVRRRYWLAKSRKILDRRLESVSG
jgi:hypothetical protein